MKKHILQMFVILLVFILLLMILQILRYGSPLPSGYVTYVHTNTQTAQPISDGLGRNSILGFSGIVLFLSVLYISLKVYKSKRE